MHVVCIARSGLAQVSIPWRRQGPWALGFLGIDCMHDTWIIRGPIEEMAPQRWCTSWCAGGNIVKILHSRRGKSYAAAALRLCNPQQHALLVTLIPLDPACWPERWRMPRQRIDVRAAFHLRSSSGSISRTCKETTRRRCGRSHSDAQVSDGITKY